MIPCKIHPRPVFLFVFFWYWYPSTSWAGDGQGGLACYDLWGLKEYDTNEWLNWTDVCQHLHTSSLWSSSHPHSVPYHHFSKTTRLEYITVFLKVTSTQLFIYSHIPFACWASAKLNYPSSHDAIHQICVYTYIKESQTDSGYICSVGPGNLKKQ